MKKTFVFLTLLILDIFLNQIIANPIVVDYFDVSKSSIFDLFFYAFVAFLITVFFEFLVGLVFLRNYLESKSKLFISYLFVHLITFPVTQLIAYGLKNSFLNGEEILIAELFPLLSEFFLLKIALNILYNKEVLINRPANGRLFLMVFLANALTYIAGFAVWSKIILF